MKIIRTSPSAFPMLSADELQEWLRIDANQDADTLQLLMSSALEMVEGITNETYGAATYQITFDGRSCRYEMPLTNVTAITAVSVAGSPVLQGWRREGCAVVFDDIPSAAPIVTVLAGHGIVDTVPDAIRHAIAILVSAGYNSREDISEATFRTVERLCSRYRRILL